MAAVKRIMSSKLGRKALDEDVGISDLNFGSFHGYVEEDPTVTGFFRSTVPTGRQVVDYLISLFPFSQWIFSYNLQWLTGDLVAGKLIWTKLLKHSTYTS
jgi:sodium-independent sulfate anion transporter 11